MADLSCNIILAPPLTVNFELESSPLTVNMSLNGIGSTLPVATAENDFIVGGSSPFAWLRKTLAQVKIILGLGSAAYSDNEDFAAAGHDHVAADISDLPDLSNLHAPGSDNQDLSNLVVKVTGKGLSTNDFTDIAVTTLSEHDMLFSYMQSSGLLWGGELTINIADQHYFDIAAGQAVVIDNYTDPEHPVKTLVTWEDQTILDPYIIDTDTVYLGLLASGELYYSLDNPFTDTQRRLAASVGWLDHTGRDVIEYTGMEPALINSIAAQFQDFLYAFGAFNLEGNEFSYSTGLQIKRTAGKAFCPNQNYINAKNSPHVIVTNLSDPTQVYYYYRSLTGWVNDTPISDYIDPEHWDDGSGTLASVVTGKWQIQAISYYPLWDAVDIQYGQVLYDDMSSAESALQNAVEIDPYNSVDVFRGWLIVKQGTTDLSNPAYAKFKSAGKWGMMDVQSGGGTGGEVNTASNEGTQGVGLYRLKSGVNLEFKNIDSKSDFITVENNLTDKTVDIGFNESKMIGMIMSMSMGGF
jgi:hypothetical protein